MKFLRLSSKQALVVSLIFLISLILYTFFIQKSLTTSTINWSDAEDLVLSCKISSISQSEKGVVTLAGKSGNQYITKEPSKDAIWELIDQVSTSCVPVFNY